MNLEDVVYHMGDAFGMDAMALKAGSVSGAIKQMVKELTAWPESEVLQNARRWFRVAQDALNDRNKVVHVVPAVWVTITSDRGVEERGPVLEYQGRKPGSYQRTAMTAEGLRPVRHRIEQAQSGWSDLFMALAAEYERLHPGRPGGQ